MTLRKGQLFRRRCDGFVFRAESTSRTCPGAFLQCVDATRVFGWFDAVAIARDFVRVTSGARSDQASFLAYVGVAS